MDTIDITPPMLLSLLAALVMHTPVRRMLCKKLARTLSRCAAILPIVRTSLQYPRNSDDQKAATTAIMRELANYPATHCTAWPCDGCSATGRDMTIDVESRKDAVAERESA